MAADGLARVRFTPLAEADLAQIWRHGAAEWSADQADRYLDALFAVCALLADMPLIARERTEFTPPVRIHATGAHLVIYRTAGPDIDVLRVMGARQDWQALLQVPA